MRWSAGPHCGPGQPWRWMALLLVLLSCSCTGARPPAQRLRPAAPQPGLAELHRDALKNPSDPAPHLRLAPIYLQLGNVSLAEGEARAAVRLAPRLADAHLTLARVLFLGPAPSPDERNARLEEAWSSLTRALELAPESLDALALGAELGIELRRYDEAGALVERLKKLEPEGGRAAKVSALFNLSRHRYAEAVPDFERAVERLGGLELVPLQAFSAFMAGDGAQALALYDSVAELYLDDRDRVILAILALRRDDLLEAEAQLRARSFRPEQVETLRSDLLLINQLHSRNLKASAVADMLEAQVAQQIFDLDRSEALLRRALEVDRRLPDAPEILAELLLFVRQDARQALRILLDAPEATAGYRRYLLYIQVYRSLQDASGAQEVLREFLEYVAGEVDAGRRQEGRKALETMILLLPVPSLWQFYVDLTVEEEDLAGLIAAWERLRATVPRLDLQFTTVTGDGLIRLGRFEQAEAMLRQALLKEPTNQSILMQLGLIAEMRGDADTAEEIYRRMTVIHPDDSRAWVLLAGHYREAGGLDEARQAYEEALRREPDRSDALVGLVDVLLRLKKGDDALLIGRRLAEAHPADPQSWLVLGRAAGEARHFGDQDTALRQAVARDQDLPESWTALARFLVGCPDPRYRKVDEGLAAAREAVERSQGLDAASLGVLSEALLESGQSGEALKAVEQAISLQPESDAWFRQRRKIRAAIESASPSRTAP